LWLGLLLWLGLRGECLLALFVLRFWWSLGIALSLCHGVSVGCR
jgi:hypothetical protein